METETGGRIEGVVRSDRQGQEPERPAKGKTSRKLPEARCEDKVTPRRKQVWKNTEVAVLEEEHEAAWFYLLASHQ